MWYLYSDYSSQFPFFLVGGMSTFEPFMNFTPNELPYGIAIDAVFGDLYWTQTATGDIWRRARLAGGEFADAERVVSTEGEPTGIAVAVEHFGIDASAVDIFWKDRAAATVERIAFDGFANNGQQSPASVAQGVGGNWIALYSGTLSLSDLWQSDARFHRSTFTTFTAERFGT